LCVLATTLEADPNVQLVERPPSATIQYMEVNNNLIPVEMRKAMCYAYDYDYLIDEIMEGFAARMTSPIPEGVLYHHYEDFDLPSMDITIARQALLDANWPGTEGLTANDDVSEGNEWASLVDDGTPLASYNYSYNIGNAVREDMLILISSNFRQIGVEIVDAGMTFSEYLYRVYEVHGFHRDHINLAWSGWIPDYNDPSNYINMLMTNQAVAANGAQVDDAQIQAWMEEALTETDPVAREQIYYNIQKRAAEEIYLWIYGYVSTLPSATAPNVRGYYTNAFEDPLMKHMYIV
jgi:ABC-type transport system substrate-binding protein